MKSKSKSCEGLYKFDLFGQSVQFTFQENEKYQTVPGVFVSLICITLLVAFVVVRT